MEIFENWQKAFKKTAEDAVMYATQVAMRHAQKLTAQNAGIPKFWRSFKKVGKKTVFSEPIVGIKPKTPAQAKRQHLNWLKYWILGVGLPKPPRRGMSSGQYRRFISQERLPKSARKNYFEVAKKEQGALAAGFSPAIIASGKKPVASYIARHGKKHGSFRVAKQAGQVIATATIKDLSSAGTAGGNKGSLHIFAEAGIRRARATMENAVKKKLESEIAKMKKKYTL